MSNRFYSLSLADTETLLLHLVLAVSVILSFIMLSWIVKKIKNISKEKELPIHTEMSLECLDFKCELPDELIDQILLRLPEESLLRFKFVCHAWNAKINSASFVKSYGECKYGSMKVMLYTGEGESPIYSFPINCREQEEEAVENIPHNFGPYDYKVKGSCDGLLLVQVKTLGRLCIWIWNPSTRQYIDLPLSENGRMGELYFPRYGFGCVNSSGKGNYKVLVIDLSRESQTQSFVMYSTFMKSWRRIENVPYRVSNDSLALVNANLHFKATNLNHEALILAFDLMEEKFKELPGPNCEDINSMSELNGKLCIIASRGDHYGIHKKMNVWVMKDCFDMMD